MGKLKQNGRDKAENVNKIIFCYFYNFTEDNKMEDENNK